MNVTLSLIETAGGFVLLRREGDGPVLQIAEQRGVHGRCPNLERLLDREAADWRGRGHDVTVRRGRFVDDLTAKVLTADAATLAKLVDVALTADDDDLDPVDLAQLLADPDLRRLIDLWPHLAEHTRRVILDVAGVQREDPPPMVE